MPRRDGARALDDRVRVQHILDAALQALSYVIGRDRTHLDTDSMLRRSLKDCIQEIGEAALRVSPDGRDRIPTLPWAQIVGMRHRIVHVYNDIDANALWEVSVRDLPILVASIQPVLAAWPEATA